MGNKPKTNPESETPKPAKAKAGKYRFLKTLVGKGGAFDKGRVYELSEELAELYSKEIERVGDG